MYYSRKFRQSFDIRKAPYKPWNRSDMCFRVRPCLGHWHRI
ncbi:hypothetical protein F383_26571 [Gossypium arboreum]|uniref:Uncharacterized protein n=1 Tax=Gossypium arboreum TaxID=29729 RepID=A0A0B0P9W0_GOSAR|nr:hypothetical protein F383_22051 [Gossypium arboreum]KHG21707.1 hypothetical protein F383_26571 [Gossypium arboreum]